MLWKINSCTKASECYPKQLCAVSSAPEILYYMGDISLCNSVVIAVIGKRDAEERYLRIAERVGSIVAQEGYTVLNGLAIGCDTKALEGAIAEGGKVIAVMPGGLDEIYPKSNRVLAEKILECGGCLVSEYPCGVRPQKFTFIQRDRIQAMLAQKVFVIEAEKDGGTMHTATFAKKLQKPLGCFSEKSGGQTPIGNQFLLDNHLADAVCDTDDLKDFVSRPEVKHKQMSLFDV